MFNGLQLANSNDLSARVRSGSAISSQRIQQFQCTMVNEWESSVLAVFLINGFYALISIASWALGRKTGLDVAGYTEMLLAGTGIDHRTVRQIFSSKLVAYDCVDVPHVKQKVNGSLRLLIAAATTLSVASLVGSFYVEVAIFKAFEGRIGNVTLGDHGVKYYNFVNSLDESTVQPGETLPTDGRNFRRQVVSTFNDTHKTFFSQAVSLPFVINTAADVRNCTSYHLDITRQMGNNKVSLDQGHACIPPTGNRITDVYNIIKTTSVSVGADVTGYDLEGYSLELRWDDKEWLESFTTELKASYLAVVESGAKWVKTVDANLVVTNESSTIAVRLETLPSATPRIDAIHNLAILRLIAPVEPAPYNGQGRRGTEWNGVTVGTRILDPPHYDLLRALGYTGLALTGLALLIGFLEGTKSNAYLIKDSVDREKGCYRPLICKVSRDTRVRLTAVDTLGDEDIAHVGCTGETLVASASRVRVEGMSEHSSVAF